jgi:thiol-disulfide isomerase/thioredoxin
MAKKSFFRSDIFMMITIIMFLLLAIVILFAYNKDKIMETFTGSTSSNKYVLEYYYMDGCGHCDNFNNSGVWERLNNSYGNNIEFKKYNMRDSKDRIEKYSISGFPTIIIIDKSNSEKKLEEYNDDRTYDKFKIFIEKYINPDIEHYANQPLTPAQIKERLARRAFIDNTAGVSADGKLKRR